MRIHDLFSVMNLIDLEQMETDENFGSNEGGISDHGENFLNAAMSLSNENFKKRYRLEKSTFEIVCALVIKKIFLKFIFF